MIYSTKHIYYQITMPDGTVGVGIKYGIFSRTIKAMLGDTIQEIVPSQIKGAKVRYLGMDKHE